jgi:hypothetical protein
MRYAALPVALGAAAACALPLAAQDRSIFSALATDGRVVAANGASPRGALSADDLVATGGRRVQVWSLDAAVGDRLQIDLRSGDFDPYLYVVGPGLGEGLTDDDGGDGLNARLCLAVEEPGEYRVVASSLSSAVGGYTLQVARRDGVTNGTCPEEEAVSGDVDDIAQLSTDGRVLEIGSDVSGALSSSDRTVLGSPAQAWAFDGVSGESLSVDLLSDDFDAYLMVQGPGLDSWLQDDDGAGGCNSRVTLDLPESGLFRVVASSLGSSVGAYRLVVTREPGPVLDEACGGRSDEPEPERNVDAIELVGELTWEQSVERSLTGSEARYDDRPMQAWSLQGEAGDRVMVEMRSADFDSYLYLTGPGFGDPIWNDDGGGNLNARLCAELPQSGTYRVLAGAYSAGEAGQVYSLHASRTTDGVSVCEDAFEISDEAIAATLAAMPTAGRTLTLGGEEEGTLGPDDARHPDSGYIVQPWSFQGEAGRTVFVDVVSDEFDAVLYALGAGIDGVLFVDDSGEGCNSRMAITPGESGRILLLPGSYDEARLGAFVIRASEDPPELEDGGCGSLGSGTTADSTTLDGISSGSDRPIELRTVVTGSLGALDEHLASGAPAQAWTLFVRAGEELTIDLRSEAFDPVLFVDGDQLETPLMDDDSAGDLDSRIVYTPTADGTLRLVVAAYSSDATGDFELTIVRAP